MEKFDLLILGAGPASFSASIYALRYNLTTAIIGGVAGGLMMESHKICNWPGEPAIIGYELAGKMQKHAEGLGAKLIIDLAETVEKVDNLWKVVTKSGKEYWAKTIIYALGTEHKHLNIPAEEKFKGRGVTYCATCDAMFYRGKKTAVVGGGNGAMTAALYLADICPEVYLIVRGRELKGEVVWMNEVKKKENIKVIFENNVVDLAGADRLEKIILDNGVNGEKEIMVEGLFVEIGLAPNTHLFKTMGGELDDWSRIKVNADMSTNLSGVFAAGDVTNGSNGFRQILTAAAEGSIAADSAYNYIKRNGV